MHPRRQQAVAAIDEAHSPPPQPLRHGSGDRARAARRPRLVRIWDPLPVEALRLRVFDLYQLIAPREATPRPVAIVDIDEDSLKSLGQWPWPRTIVADLVTRVTQMGAVAIGFDVVFPEPDRISPALAAEASAASTRRRGAS